MSMIVNDWPARYAKTRPSAIAVTDAARGETRDWAQLDRRAGGLAGYLAREAFVGPGDRVAILAENRVAHAEALFAVARLRAALVPLNHKLAPAELARVFASAAPRALLVSDDLLGVAHGMLRTGPLAGLPPLVVPLDGPLYEDAAGGPRDGAPAEAVVSEDDPWLVLYTSGSTGRPKGALVTHRQVIWNAVQTTQACELGREDSTLTYTPLFYTGGWNVLSTPVWYRGGAVHLLPAFDAPAILRTLERQGVSTVFGVPTTLAGLAAAPGFAVARLERLRVVLCGGAACPPGLLEAYRARGLCLRPGYGLTEVGPNCFGVLPEDAARKAGSIGRPNLHLEARVTDDAGAPVAPGAAGELRLRGPTVFGGYLANPAATSAALDAEGFFRTGDIVRVDADGFYWLVGRKDDLFKSGGEKVYAGEVEAAIARHPAVAEVVVFGVPDARWGEVGRAVVVPRPAAGLEAEDLRGFLEGELARFKIPKSFVLVEALPRTDTGKIARPAVRARFAPAEAPALSA